MFIKTKPLPLVVSFLNSSLLANSNTRYPSFSFWYFINNHLYLLYLSFSFIFFLNQNKCRMERWGQQWQRQNVVYWRASCNSSKNPWLATSRLAGVFAVGILSLFSSLSSLFFPFFPPFFSPFFFGLFL